MALIAVKRATELGRSCVLAPERYDPRRESLTNKSNGDRSVPLGSIVATIGKTISPTAEPVEAREYLVFDTTDVREGFVIGRKRPSPLHEIGSSKKLFRCHDILISRLRPYLRQVAFVDAAVGAECDADLLCSTEFFVLRSLTENSIAFLVPYLLSAPVQAVLAASQEGGHHPRFSAEALTHLPVPASLVDARAEISKRVIESAARYRESEHSTIALIAEADVAVNAIMRPRPKRAGKESAVARTTRA